ncbi:hypothetical protein ACES2L_14350 [Bdellovibrio bacteriovorus]
MKKYLLIISTFLFHSFALGQSTPNLPPQQKAIKLDRMNRHIHQNIKIHNEMKVDSKQKELALLRFELKKVNDEIQKGDSAAELKARRTQLQNEIVKLENELNNK